MKITALILALLLIFGLVGCNYEETPVESSQVSESTGEESVDPSEFFPENMSVNDFVVRVVENEELKQPDSDTKYLEVVYGYKETSQTRRFIGVEMLDLRSVATKGNVGRDAAGESHIVMLGDCLLIAIAVYDMKDGCAYVVKDSTNSGVMTDNRFYTHTNPDKANEGNNYGQAFQLSAEVDENGNSDFVLTYGYPVWHYIVKKYRSIPENYVLTVTEKLYENDKVVSENVTFTLTYQDIQEALE